MRVEHNFPDIIDRDTFGTWATLGRKSTADRAEEKVQQILGETPPNTVNDDIRSELSKIMESEARLNGVDGIPDINIE